MKPLAIDLYCGLGGWADGLLAEGFEVIGFDLERHDYGSGGYPGSLVLQDVLTLHGSQFKDAAIIVGSSPCQEFSFRAMPWKAGKVVIPEVLPNWWKKSESEMDASERSEWETMKRDHPKPPPTLGIALFEAQFRIQREACLAAGRHIPLICENVRGAQPWVGRSDWRFGSFHLWGDVPALMPIPGKRVMKDGIAHRNGGATNFHREYDNGIKAGDRCLDRESGKWTTDWNVSLKVGGDWFGSYAEQKEAGTISPGRLHGKGSTKRKAASATIARIPLALSRHIARCFYPQNCVDTP